MRSSAWDERAHLKAERRRKARGRDVDTDTTHEAGGARQVRTNKKRHEIGRYRRPRQQATRSSQVTYRPHTPVSRPAGQPSKPSLRTGSGCGRLWAGRARCHNRARRVHRAERPARVRALGPAACRAAAASSGRGTIWTYGVANVDQTLIRKTRPASDEEIRHAVEGRPGSRAPAKWATSSTVSGRAQRA